MELEKQCVSLELAKKLKELGVKQESLFYWVKMKDYWPLLVLCKEDNTFVRVSGFDAITDIETHYSAFTVAELGEMLPDIIAPSNTFGLEYSRRDEEEGQRHMVAYTPISAVVFSLAFINDIGTEADARAKMLIYLLENKLINPSADKAGEKERGV